MTALCLVAAAVGAVGYLAALTWWKPPWALLASLVVAAFTFLGGHSPVWLIWPMVAASICCTIVWSLPAYDREDLLVRLRRLLPGTCHCPRCTRAANRRIRAAT